jgi:carboxyl-terminal processing protease
MLKRIVTIGFGVIAGYLMTLGVVEVVAAWGLWPDRETSRAADQVSQVMRLLNRHYVDPNAVGGAKLADHAIESMVGSLDPYSQFLPPKAYQHLEEEVDGEFGGIGVQVEELDGRIVVVAPIAGTPGERAGILRGDVLVKVDGSDVRGLKLVEFIGKLRGRPGTSVTVGIERGEPVREIEFRLKREIIKVESVRDAELLDDGIGYVRVTMFAEKTGEEFKAAVKKLREQGARALVIDLRNNPGGLLTAAVEVVEPFFPRDELVVYTQGRDPNDREELRSENGRDPWQVPIAVLVNGGSASAAEIVAGALKDTRRAVLVGEKTFGKGSVQTIFTLKGNSALRLTTARYFTPSGVTIHEKGIQPDFREAMTPEQEKAVFLHRLRPDISDPEQFKERFGVSMVEDRQLALALRALHAELAGKPLPRTKADDIAAPDATEPSEKVSSDGKTPEPIEKPAAPDAAPGTSAPAIPEEVTP